MLTLIALPPVYNEDVVAYQPVVFLNVTLVRLLQLLKQLFPILLTLSGIVIDVKLVHLKKAESPILVTLFPMVIAVKFWQFPKVLYPILVTLFPMVIDVKLVHL